MGGGALACVDQLHLNIVCSAHSVTGQGVEAAENDPAAGALVPSAPEQRHREASWPV